MSSPEELFERFRRRSDPAALAAVFDALAPELLLVAGHVAERDGEDLVQATFLDAIEKRDRWDGERPLMPWLIGILVNHARATRRKRARQADPAELAPGAEPSPIELLESAEVQEQLSAAMESLPQNLRVVVTMRLAHGLTPTAIAHTLGCPVDTVKTRLQRGREWLRKALPSGIGVSAVAALVSGGSLAAAREVVLAKAASLAPVATAGTATAATAVAGATLLGGLVMKKVIAVVVVVALVCIGGAIWFGQSENGTAPNVDGHAVVRAEPANVTRPVADSPPAVQRSAPAVGDPAEPAPTDGGPGDVTLQFVWQGTDEPAPRLGVHLYPTDGDFVRDGSDHVVNDAGRLQIELPPGEYSISNARVQHEFEVRRDGPTRERIEVEPWAWFAGRVVDADGNGVAGAAIHLERERSSAAPPPVVAVTDADGAFHGGLDNGGHLWAHKAGLQRSDTVRMRPGQNTDMQFVVAAPVTHLRGVVRGVDHRPAADALVAILELEPTVSNAPVVVRTDAAGRFATDALPTGTFSLIVNAAGHAMAHRECTLVEGERRELEITLERGAAVYGSVVLEGSERDWIRVAAVPVWAERRLFTERFVKQHASPGAAGDYRIEHVPAGSVLLEASRMPDSRQRLELVDGEERRVDFGSAGASSIRGRLVDRNGEPVSGWWLFAYSESSGRGKAGAIQVDGSFEVAGLTGSSYRVVAMPQTVSSSEPWVEVSGIRPGTTEVELRAQYLPEDGAILHGVLVDPDGEPVTRASLSYRPADSKLGWRHKDAKIEPDGTFEIGPLPPGNYHFSLHLPDLGDMQVASRTLAPRERVDLGTLRMPGKGRLLLRFVTADGTSVHPDRITASDPAGNFAHQFEATDDGAHRSEAVPAGAYRVKTWGADYLPCEETVDVIAGEAIEHRIPLTAATPVTFAFQRDGVPAGQRWQAHVVLSLHRAGALVAKRFVWVDGTGAFEWTRGLTAGRYDYVAELQETGEAIPGSFTVGAGVDPRVEVKLPAAR